MKKPSKIMNKLRAISAYLLVLPTSVHFLLFFIAPLCILFVYSFYRFIPGGAIEQAFIWSNYEKFIFDPYYRAIFYDTMLLGIKVTVIDLLLGYPLAYMLARTRSRFRGFLYLLVVMPLLTSAVVRTYGWMVILSRNGILNSFLMNYGFISEPFKLMYNQLGVIIGLTEVLLPFMTLTLVSVLESIDPAITDAAGNLGANPITTFFKVTFPLSLPGVAAGSILVFIMSISAFVTPTLMGGPEVRVMSTLIYEQALYLVNWPFAGAMSFTLLLIVGTLIIFYNKLLVSSKSWEVSR